MEERPLSHRLAALLTLLALIAAAVVSAWWILTDRADFRGLVDRPPTAVESGAAAPSLRDRLPRP